MGVAMIMWYQADLREKHRRIWDQLYSARMATFSIDLTANGLKLWPVAGPHAFNKAK